MTLKVATLVVAYQIIAHQKQFMPKDHSFISGGSAVARFVWNVLFVLFYPLITTFSLLFVGVLYVFSLLSKLISRVSASADKGIELTKPEWESFAQIESHNFEKLFVDEIMFGPAYYSLRSFPASDSLKDKLFGDFFHPFASGALLQQWNTINVTEIPDFQLVYFDLATGKLTDVARIKSFSWSISDETDDALTLKWFTGTEGGDVVVRKKDVCDAAIQ